MSLNLFTKPRSFICEYCFASYRTKLQQQSSQLEELERQKGEIADLQQVSPRLGLRGLFIC